MPARARRLDSKTNCAIVTELDFRRRAPAVVKYLKAQLVTREQRYGEALAALECM